MMSNYKNVLVLAPHTDDGELGCGGYISRLLEEGAEVYYAAFSTAKESVPVGYDSNILKTEVRAATSVLGIDAKNLFVYDFQVRKLNYVRQEILEELISLRKKINFDLVLMPSLNDLHQDHKTVAEEGLRAFKQTNILCYELIWNNLSFNTQCFVKLQQQHIEQKVRALQEYKSQSARDYMSKEFIFALAKTRGVQIGCDYAEAYEVVRKVV
ncbi:MAG: PIG-L family deacetylase [Bacteroidetes bacterium]|nr:PIG-L family deacetylase [Bacteroidota bacterium]